MGRMRREWTYPTVPVTLHTIGQLCLYLSLSEKPRCLQFCSCARSVMLSLACLSILRTCHRRPTPLTPHKRLNHFTRSCACGSIFWFITLIFSRHLYQTQTVILLENSVRTTFHPRTCSYTSRSSSISLNGVLCINTCISAYQTSRHHMCVYVHCASG